MNPTELPSLYGRACLIADADTEIGAAVHERLLHAGATVIALRNHDRRARESRPSLAAQTISLSTDLDDPAPAINALAWALQRTQRLDIAVLTGSESPGARIALAATAAHDLSLTAHFDVEPTSTLIYLAPPEERPRQSLAWALRTMPFIEQVRVAVIDAWPDTPKSAIASIFQVLTGSGTTSPGEHVAESELW